MNDAQTLTTAQVADRLQVRPRTVAGWCREGLVRHIRLPNGQYRIPQAELEELTAVEDARR